MRIAKTNHYSITKTKNGKFTDIQITIHNNNFSLYRYRPINKYTVEQFINDELYATVPAAFNDPYDATIRFETKAIKKHIKSRLLEKREYLDRLLSKNNLNFNQIDKLVNFIYQRDISPNIYIVNSLFSLVCLSTDVNQEIMWAHYANLATGFALEYGFEDLKELNIEHQKAINKIIKSPLLPVVYDNEKYDITNWCSEYVDLILDSYEKTGEYNPLSLAIKMSITNKESADSILPNVYCRKKMPWSYENEWRLIFYNHNPLIGQANNYFVNIGKLVPKSIYLGEKISNYDKNALIDIARKKGLNIFEMKTVMSRKTIKLRPVKIG